MTALAIVVAGAGLGVVIAERDAGQAITVDSMTMRAAQMDSHLGTLVVTGRAQIGAMREAELLQQRIDAGRAQAGAIHEAELLQQRINTGLVQQAAIDALVEGGPEAGLR